MQVVAACRRSMKAQAPAALCFSFHQRLHYSPLHQTMRRMASREQLRLLAAKAEQVQPPPSQSHGQHWKFSACSFAAESALLLAATAKLDIMISRGHCPSSDSLTPPAKCKLLLMPLQHNHASACD